jgi:hypothetical protein
MSGKILTRDEYADALVRFYADARREAIRRLEARTYQEAIDRALVRFDAGAELYGPWDLTAKDLVAECDQELDDAPAYLVAQRVKTERGL